MKMNKKHVFLISLILLLTSLTGCSNERPTYGENVTKPARAIKVKVENYAKEIEISGNVKPGKLVKAGF
jgi:hypothetical protein